MEEQKDFLPLSASEMAARGWDSVDFVYVTGDAYVDHPSFGTALLSRLLEKKGFRVGILAQPDFRSCEAFREFGRPRLGFLISAGNLDSMVAHFTVEKKRRTYDYYSPNGETGHRPDRAVIVYSNRVREAYGDIPLIIGGIEASLRRFAHYDYWTDSVRRSILLDSRADLLSYGMGERSIVRIAELLDKGVPVGKIRDVRGTAFVAPLAEEPHFPYVVSGEYESVRTDKKAYAESFRIQYGEMDSVRGKAVVENYSSRRVIVNPPSPPLEREELDEIYALPFRRNYHPSYEDRGGIPAIAEVKFSVTHNRGCFGACNFCAIAFHQGREVRSRSIESVVKEVEGLTKMPDFKGYINDVGGPTANFRHPSCTLQKENGMCRNQKCLGSHPCKNLIADHTEYVELLRKIRKVDGVKKVFIRSGIRFDYLLLDRDPTFFRELVSHHVSGQLKVAPEHCSSAVLEKMGKPDVSVYNAFVKKYFSLCAECGKEQYLVPYLMSSHPGSTLADAIDLAVYLKENRCRPEQVQDFYPTPGTVSTVMFYTGLDPLTGKEVYVARDPEEKRMQRALLQCTRPESEKLVRKALALAGREDLIGFGPHCLVRPEKGGERQRKEPKGQETKKQDRKNENRVHHENRPRNRKDRGSAGGRNRKGK